MNRPGFRGMRKLRSPPPLPGCSIRKSQRSPPSRTSFNFLPGAMTICAPKRIRTAKLKSTFLGKVPGSCRPEERLPEPLPFGGSRSGLLQRLDLDVHGRVSGPWAEVPLARPGERPELGCGNTHLSRQSFGLRLVHAAQRQA